MTDKGSGRPAGPFSIGRALEIPAGSVNDDLRLVVEAVDRVHGVGHLPRIPMEFRNQLGMGGRFDFNVATGEPIRIVVDRRAPHRILVALHEIGHFLDLAAFGDGPLFGSTINSLLSGLSPSKRVWLSRVLPHSMPNSRRVACIVTFAQTNSGREVTHSTLPIVLTTLTLKIAWRR
jgi:hypothetical protein